MANSIDDFLSKSSQEQKDKFQALVADVTKDTKATVELQEADPQKTPPQTLSQATPQPEGGELVEPTAKNLDIEAIKSQEQHKGNNFEKPAPTRKQNAVDRAVIGEAGRDLHRSGVTADKEADKDR